MAGLLAQLQTVEGIVLKQVHKALGFKALYTLVTDLTTDPLTTVDLTIFLNPTPKVRKREREGGRFQDILESGGQLSPEALPVYILARPDLKVAGVFREPTTMDTFVQFGTTSPVFHVSTFIEIGPLAAGWLLTVTTKFRDSASG